MLDHLHQLDQRLLSNEGDRVAQVRTYAIQAVTLLGLLVIVAALADGAEPRDWFTIMPGVALAFVSRRVAQRNSLPA